MTSPKRKQRARKLEATLGKQLAGGAVELYIEGKPFGILRSVAEYDDATDIAARRHARVQRMESALRAFAREFESVGQLMRDKGLAYSSYDANSMDAFVKVCRDALGEDS